MLTKEHNDRLTRVGSGTLMGEFWRRYWHPIADSSEIGDENLTKEYEGAIPLNGLKRSSPRIWTLHT
jgi:hypothetical protein